MWVTLRWLLTRPGALTAEVLGGRRARPAFRGADVAHVKGSVVAVLYFLMIAAVLAAITLLALKAQGET